MRVLVTRPERAAASTLKRLGEMGHEPIAMPLFEPEYLPIEDQRQQNVKAIALTSSNAAIALERNDQVERWRNIPVYAVGTRTAEAARKAGFTNISSAEGSGRELADLLHSSMLPGENLLYFAGEPRSPGFEQSLSDYGLNFETCICYRMKPLNYQREALQVLLSHQPEAVLLYSRETAIRFFHLLAENSLTMPSATRFLCLSHNIALAVPSDFKNRTFSAENPVEESLFLLL